MRWRERDGVRWLEADLPGARAAFTARLGGSSAPPFDSLNLAVLTGDDVGAVRENRRRASAALDLDPERVLMGRQVHGADVATHTSPQRPSAYARPGPKLADVDGQATSVDGLAPVVLVADCLPIALAGPGGVAMIHCGWRGLAGGIVAAGVEAVRGQAAAVGPGIGPCCYEVGPEVLAEFGDLGGGIASGRLLDLRAVAARLLAAAGVDAVEVAEQCTSCNPDLFFSHRRDGERTGRQGGFAWLV
jgi:YfiH family protein